MSHTPEDTARLDQAWHVALHVALAASLLAAAAGVMLYRFLGVDPRVVLLVLAPFGLTVGRHLPPARPSWLHGHHTG